MAGSTASAFFAKYEGVLVKHLSRYQESSYVLCCDVIAHVRTCLCVDVYH